MPYKKLRPFLITVFSWISIGLWAQTVDQTVAIADTFMHSGRFGSAAKYYQRAYFFASKEQVPEIRGKMADAFFMSGDYASAEKYYHQAQNFETVDTLKTEWFLKKISAIILQKKFKLAQLSILNYRGNYTPRQMKNRYFLLGTIYFGQEKFDQAKKWFARALPGNDSVKHARLELLFRKRNLMRPNPQWAYWMSIFVPGSGQIYAGDWKNGLNSFALNGFLIYLFLLDMQAYSFWDSFFAIYPWVQRYWMGGYQRAKRIAREKRAQNRARTFRRVKQLIYTP